MKLNISTFILLIIVSAVLHSYSDEAYSINKRANNLYKNKQYKDALKEYDDALLLSPSDARLKMNKGSAHYQLGEFDKAEEAYNAALSSDNKDQIADAHYNMGNILFRQGAQMYQQGPQKSLEKFKAAYDHYIKSLEARPSDIDTKWNLQLAHQVMKQLEQQQQNQKDDKDKQDNKDNKDKDNKDKDKDDKNKQDNKDQNKNDQNKQDQNKQDQKDQDQQQQQDKKDDQKNQQQDKDKEQQQNQDEKQQQQHPEMKEQDLKKEEARRIIEMFSDDADTLNKPMTKQKAAGMRQPTQDW